MWREKSFRIPGSHIWCDNFWWLFTLTSIEREKKNWLTKIHLIGKPTITYTTPNATIFSTDQLKLTCQAFGIPTPILTWHYNGHLLLTTARIYYDNKINSTTTSTNNNNKIYINQYSNGININSFPLHNRTVDLANINEMKRYYGVVTLSSSSSSSSAINNNEITFDLMLPSTAKKRSGKFSCFAGNAIGRDEKHSFVKVLGERDRLLKRYNSVEFQCCENDQQNLFCSSSDI